MSELGKRWDALWWTVDGILFSEDADKEPKIKAAVTDFTVSIQAALPTLLEGLTVKGESPLMIALQKVQRALEDTMTMTTDDTVVKGDAARLEGLAAELRSYITKSEDAPPETLRSLSCRALDDLATGIREREPELTKEAALVKAMHQVPGLVNAYNVGQARGEPLEFAPAPVAKRELPPAPAWDRIDAMAKVKLEKGAAKTIEQARELVGAEHPELYREAMAE